MPESASEIDFERIRKNGFFVGDSEKPGEVLSDEPALSALSGTFKSFAQGEKGSCWYFSQASRTAARL